MDKYLPMRHVLPPKQQQPLDEILLEEHHLPILMEEIENAEKAGLNKFHYFTDVEMMYYYVHEQKDIDEKKNRRENTKKVYIHELKSFLETLVKHADIFQVDGNLINEQHSLLKALTPWNLRRYQSWLKTAPLGRKKQPYAIATLSKKSVIIRSFLSFLYKWKYITYPLHEEMQRSNVRPEDRPNRDLSYDEVQEILHYYRERNGIVEYTFLLLLSTTGLRVRELCQANMNDLFYAEGSYWLKVIGKRQEYREVYISDYAFRCIRAFRSIRGLDTVLHEEDATPMLTTLRKKAYNPTQLSAQVTEMVERTQLPFLQYREQRITPHTFRHAFAIMAAEKGADIFRIQQTLGHKKLDTTKIYLEKYMKRKHNAALAFADDIY
jgi:integrase/recombinase XerD